MLSHSTKMLESISDFKKIIKDMVENAIVAQKMIDYFVVTGVNSNQTLNIKRLNTNEPYDEVEMLGVGLGNGKGQVKLPDVDDIVVCAFIADSQIPVVLGTHYDVFSTKKDARMDVRSNEYFVNNKINGSYIHIDEDDNIIFKTPEGAKLRLAADGSLKLFNKTNHGIEIDASGNMIIRSVSEDHLTSAGSWP